MTTSISNLTVIVSSSYKTVASVEATHRINNGKGLAGSVLTLESATFDDTPSVCLGHNVCPGDERSAGIISRFNSCCEETKNFGCCAEFCKTSEKVIAIRYISLANLGAIMRLVGEKHEGDWGFWELVAFTEYSSGLIMRWPAAQAKKYSEGNPKKEAQLKRFYTEVLEDYSLKYDAIKNWLSNNVFEPTSELQDCTEYVLSAINFIRRCLSGDKEALKGTPVRWEFTSYDCETEWEEYVLSLRDLKAGGKMVFDLCWCRGGSSWEEHDFFCGCGDWGREGTWYELRILK